MAIKGSVGHNGTNDYTDVKVVQAALNLSQSNRFGLPQKLSIDGKIGNKTTLAIKSFQKQIVGLNFPDGRIDPKGKTLSTIKQRLSKGL